MDKLAETYNEIARMYATKSIHLSDMDLTLDRSFSGGSELLVKFFHREDDNRAGLLCQSSGMSGSRKSACLPLNVLEIRRPPLASSLQLCRKASADLELWANLTFTTIEREFIVTLFLTGHLDLVSLVACQRDV
jgi:hypothetical protein